MKIKHIIPLFLTVCLLLSGCKQEAGDPGDEPAGSPTGPSLSIGAPAGLPDRAELFSDRDFDAAYEEAGSTLLTLNGASATSSTDAATVSGSAVRLTQDGTYIISGQLEDGQIIVDAGPADLIHIVLNGAAVNSSGSAPVCILQAGKVILTLAEGSENSLTGGGPLAAMDGDTSGAVYAESDLTLNSSGALTASAPDGHGIAAKGALAVTGGSYRIDAAGYGLNSEKSVGIAAGSLTIVSGQDGLHAEELIHIAGGDLHISSGSGGIASNGTIAIKGGETYISGPDDGSGPALRSNAACAVSGGILIAVSSGTTESYRGFGMGSAQSSVAVTLDAPAQAGEALTLLDPAGGVLLTWAPEKGYETVIISCPEIAAGETYTIVTDTSRTEVSAAELSGIAGGAGAFGGRPGGFAPGGGTDGPGGFAPGGGSGAGAFPGTGTFPSEGTGAGPGAFQGQGPLPSEGTGARPGGAFPGNGGWTGPGGPTE